MKKIILVNALLLLLPFMSSTSSADTYMGFNTICDNDTVATISGRDHCTRASTTVRCPANFPYRLNTYGPGTGAKIRCTSARGNTRDTVDITCPSSAPWGTYAELGSGKTMLVCSALSKCGTTSTHFQTILTDPLINGTTTNVDFCADSCSVDSDCLDLGFEYYCGGPSQANGKHFCMIKQ